MSKKPVLLCIMDGFGWVPNETYGNAVVAAKTPHLDALMAKYPMTTIEASGMAVGLPDGQMGNSEVGHTNMGAGRIVYQQLTLITKSIRDGEMFKNPVLVKNMKAAIEAGKAIHLMGLVGTGGVHSHADHWFGVLEMAKHMGAKEVYLHASPMAVIPTPTQARASWLTCRPSWMSWALARSPAFPAVTTPWIATTTGTARRRLTPHSSTVRATTLPTLPRPLRHPMLPIRPTSSFCPASPVRVAACRMAIPSSL